LWMPRHMFTPPSSVSLGAGWRADLHDVRALRLEHLGRICVSVRDPVLRLKIGQTNRVGIDGGDELQPVVQRGDGLPVCTRDAAGADDCSAHGCSLLKTFSVYAECPAYAVATAAAFSRPSSSTAVSRILNFWTLPVTVIGKPSTNFQ